MLMAAGTQVRQNGIIAGLFAAAAVGWIGGVAVVTGGVVVNVDRLIQQDTEPAAWTAAIVKLGA